MKFFISIFAIVLSILSASATKIRIVDAEDSSPLVGATVFSKSGIILGLSDANGEIESPTADDYPLTVRCLGYLPTEAKRTDGTVRMKYDTFALDEMVVTPADRPVCRVVCYVREYISSVVDKDTMINFNEHMADFFLPTKKVKGFKARKSPRFLRSRLYSRRTGQDGRDSIFKPEFRNDMFAWESLVEMPEGTIRMSDAISSGAPTDTIAGKHAAKQFNRRTPELYISRTDYLADAKSHRLSPTYFKLLGLTIDIEELQGTWIYRINDSGIFTAADIISGTFSFKVEGKGKWIKKSFKTDNPVEIYSFYEIYPVETEYLTVEEAKTLVKEEPSVKMKVSPHAPPLSPSIQRIVDTFKRR